MGLPSLKPCLVTLSVHHSAASMMDVLVPEACESPQWVAEGAPTDCPVTTIIPTWKTLTTLDMSHNHIGCIDNSVTLNLAGNRLVSLAGLTKLYSLVNLDLSSNKLGQVGWPKTAFTTLEEIRYIGTLPCLERLILSNNPMCIIPDYRTKVLAQFWDRASEWGRLPCSSCSISRSSSCSISRSSSSSSHSSSSNISCSIS
uniref:Uncharacterized protein n=1 Tax=Hucho hucho TaxID=62062 RepID=A0A4W5KUP0_9TELE